MKIDLVVLSYKRPLSLLITLLSLSRLARNLTKNGIDLNVVIVDQGGSSGTKLVINFFKLRLNAKTVLLDQNVGIGKGWTVGLNALSEQSPHLMLVEDDWWFINKNPKPFVDCIELLKNQSDVKFVRFRKCFDFQAGACDVRKNPQNVKPFPIDILTPVRINDSLFYVGASKNICFTFNPCIYDQDFLRKEILKLLRDVEVSYVGKLKSAEHLPTIYWEKSPFYAAQAVPGSVRHIGYHSRRYRLFLPIILFIELLFGSIT